MRWMIDLAVRAGADRIVLNGSFVTDIMEPNDVDCALLFTPGALRDPATFTELQKSFPFLEIVDREEFDEFVNRTFATDRIGTPKGMIEVIP